MMPGRRLVFVSAGDLALINLTYFGRIQEPYKFRTPREDREWLWTQIEMDSLIAADEVGFYVQMFVTGLGDIVCPFPPGRLVEPSRLVEPEVPG